MRGCREKGGREGVYESMRGCVREGMRGWVKRV